MAPANWRSRKKPQIDSGSSTRSSTTRNATSIADGERATMTIRAEPKPKRGASISA